MNTLDSSSEFNLHKRRSSFFKPTVEDDEILKQSLTTFIISHREQGLKISSSPITWERIATGYRIIDFQVERTNEVLDLLKRYYFCSNQSCATTTLYIDSHTINTYQQFILEIISDYNSFCVIEEGTGKIVGVAMAKSNAAQDETLTDDNVLTSRDVFNVLRFEEALLKEANIYENYKVDKYFCIYIVCVKPDYYSKGIGTSLVRACLSKAQKQQYSVCIGIFSAGPSQTIAQRFGFEILAEMPWINVKESKSNVYIGNHRHSYLDHARLENSFVTCMGALVPSVEYVTMASDKIINETE